MTAEEIRRVRECLALCAKTMIQMPFGQVVQAMQALQETDQMLAGKEADPPKKAAE